MENVEEKILSLINWKDKNYNGNLVHNVITSHNNHIADIVCIRRDNFIELKWLNPNSEPIILHYSKENHTFEQLKSDPSLSDEQSINLFLECIKKLVNYSQVSFFPMEKIKSNKIQPK